MTSAALTGPQPSGATGSPRQGRPHSVRQLMKAHLRGEGFHYLRRFATPDVLYFCDDFTGKAIDTTNTWAVANGGGAGAASFATVVAQNGIVRATTGTAGDATASASLIGPLIYPGSANPWMEVRFRVHTANTSVKLEFGFINAVPGSNGGGINNMDTPTANMTDGAIVGIDTGATANKVNLVTIGSATNQAIKQTLGTLGLPGVDTYVTVRVALFSQEANVANAVNVAAWLNGNGLDGSPQPTVHDISATAGVGAVNGSVLLAPWVYIRALNGTSKSLDLDYVRVECDRSV